MLSKISWQEFISFLMLVFAAYYLVVLFKFYRREMLQIMRGKQDKLEKNETTNKIS
jgi:hypothetical protein